MLSRVLLLATCSVLVATRPLDGVSLPANFSYLLPRSFNGNIASNFADTTTSDSQVNGLMTRAQNASYISFDNEFIDIVGTNGTVQELNGGDQPREFAYEAGIWVYDHNEVWFTSYAPTARPIDFYILNLGTLTITKPNISIQHGPNLVGGYYFNGKVYFTVAGNVTLNVPPGIVSVDPTTLETETIINSYFGVPLNSVDDLTWVAPGLPGNGRRGHCVDGPELFLTSTDLSAYNIFGFANSVLPNAVYRFNPRENFLKAAISRADLLEPNGLATWKNYLFASDTAGRTTGIGPANYSSGSAAIYRFELDEDCNPFNKIMFALTRSGISDGIHVDDYGRVWSAEYDGIVVRNTKGKEIGVFNAEVLGPTTDAYLGNFALAGDKLIILAVDRIFVVQLAQTVFSSRRLQAV